MVATVIYKSRLFQELVERNQYLVRQADLLKEAANRDTLTGVLNWVAVMTSLERQIRAGAAVGRTLGVIMADIDHFKEINDSDGYAAGDMALREFTRRLATIIRQSDYFGRYGGEEFLLLVGDANWEQVMHASERFRLAIADTPFDVGAVSRPVTASFGIALTSAPPSPRRPSLRRPAGRSTPPRPAAGTGVCLRDPSSDAMRS